MPPIPDRPIYTPPGGPPANHSLSREIFAHMGEEKVRALIADFYVQLVESPIQAMFPPAGPELEAAIDRSAAFFSFLFGGPPLYQQRYGRPMMRARHLPFEIDEAARLVWMACYRAALDTSIARGDFPEQHAAGLLEFLEGFSGWMVNSSGAHPD